MQDLCIVGGGMSGMTAAITAAQMGSRVILIEKNNKLGKKIYATGNGKCNLTNKNMDYSLHFNSSNLKYETFLSASCGEDAYDKVIDFINTLGIYTTDINGYVYPTSHQASSVVWAMIDKMQELGVEIMLKTTVNNINKKENYFEIKTDDTTIKAHKVILACGGNSYSKLGGSMSGYNLAKDLGHKIISLRPCLCGLCTYENISFLSGVRVSAIAKLICNNNIISTEKGELQFTDYGISGIMIFNLSSKAGKLLTENKDVYIELNLMPEFSEEEYDKLIDNNQSRTIVGLLNSLVNDRIASYFTEKHKLSGKEKVTNINRQCIYEILNDLKKFTVRIKSTKDFENAQVSAGGVDISQINEDTFMSRLISDLYITGEMLDIDGLCGGYNITFAILSGLKAGYSSYDKN